MIWIFLISLALLTFVSGIIPLSIKMPNSFNAYLLAFSGALLLGISFLHLLPECFVNAKTNIGIYILVGFFVQLFLQKFSHGLEHGHVHTHEHEHTYITPIIIGLCVHAFLEGIPLGYSFSNSTTLPSLFIGIMAHKAPETITLMSLLITLNNSKKNKYILLLIFALVTPCAGAIAYYFGRQYAFISNMLNYLLPIVVGAFIQIATTILFESGAKHHELHIKKILAIAIGLMCALITLCF